MATYPFLSDDWFAAVDRLVEEMGAEAPSQADLVMNVVVTETPFGGETPLHVGARQGRGHWGTGHVPDADLSITTDYDTAREILLSGDPQAGLNAFFGGRVRIQGDLAKLLTTVQAGGAPTGATDLVTAILGITE
jgi:hypothetical protein